MKKPGKLMFNMLIVCLLLTQLPLWAADLNVAPDGIATQSTTCFTRPPEAAIDGDPTNFTHTCNTDFEPQWQVVLDDIYDIARIVIHNRDSCCGSRLRDIQIVILDEEGDENIVYESDLLNPENELGAFPLGPDILELDLIADEGEAVTGGIVRILRIPDDDLSGTGGQGNADEANVLSMGEVEIYIAYEGATPIITQQPVGGRASEGDPVTFSVAAEVGQGELTYQWKKDGTDIPGATEATYTLDFVEKADSGDYSVVVSANGEDVESEIASLDVLGFNAAPFGVATQSSQLGGYGPDLAIDGNLDNFTHTQGGQPDAWWELDLLDFRQIEKILIFNRTSCCGSRLRDITVEILDDPMGDVIWSSELLNEENEMGAFPLGPELLEIDLILEEGEAIEGRVIRISRLSDADLSGSGGQGNQDEADVLSLGEVEVYTDVPECPDVGDTHMLEITLEGPGDNMPGEYIISAIAEDDSGDEGLSYTFSLTNAMMPDALPIVIGPQAEEFILHNLNIGAWTITVTADDDLICDDEAEDNSLSEEIEILGDPENLAWQGTVTQSTTCFNDPAYYAVDGDMATFSHTCGTDDAATWEVDFGSPQEIFSIVIHNRAGYGSRLRDITVTILDGAGQELFVSDLLNPENEEGIFPEGPMEILVDLDELTGDAVTGQIVRISRTPDPDLSGSEGQGNTDEANTLTLVEVVIDGERSVLPDGTNIYVGDVNGDSSVNLADAISLLTHLFVTKGLPCEKSADANDDGTLNLADAISILTYQFQNGTLSAPDGSEITSANIGCIEYPDAEVADLGCDNPCE